MNRRDLLKLGAVATSAPGCATVLNAASVVPESLTSVFAKLDAQLLRLDGESSLSKLLGDTPHAEKATAAPWFQEGDALARKTLKSFLIAGAFQSLTPEQWQQPLVTERLNASMADLDEAMLGMTAMLERLPQDNRKALGKALRDDPALGMRIMGAIDERAGEYGVSLDGRTKLRAASAQAVSRMRQSPDLIIAEVTGKIRKLEARHGVTEEARRRVGVTMANLALFQDGAQPASGGQAPPPPLPQPTPPPPPPVVPMNELPTTASDVSPTTSAEELQERRNRIEERRREDRKRGGLVTLTVGAAALGIGVLLGVTGNLGLITLGVLLGGAGLIALVVGLIIFLASF